MKDFEYYMEMAKSDVSGDQIKKAICKLIDKDDHYDWSRISELGEVEINSDTTSSEFKEKISNLSQSKLEKIYSGMKKVNK